MRVKTWILLFGIALLAFLTLFFYGKLTKTPYLMFSDAAKFADMGRQIIKGQGFSTNFAFFASDFYKLSGQTPFATNWFPLFPLAMALNFSLFGAGDKVVVFTSGFFFIFSAVLIFFLAAKLFGKAIGMLSAITFIFTSSMLEYASIGASESLFVWEIILATYLLLFKNKWSSFLAGIIAGLMFLSRQQAPIYFLGFLILLVLTKKQRLTGFLAGTVSLLGPVFLIGTGNSINLFGQQPLSLIFERSGLVAQNATLRGGMSQFSLPDVIINFKPLAVKTFYNLYNFYKSLPSLVSPFLAVLYFLSLLRWKKEEIPFRLTTIFLLILSIVAASLTIPFMRYIHPVVPLMIILGVEMLVWTVSQLFKPGKKVFLLSLGFILFFVVGPTLGQIFLDSRFLVKTVNSNKPPINFILGKMVGEETRPNDLVVTNLDTWGSWYGERKTVWLPFKPDQLIPPSGQKTKIDAIFLTSYLANDPAQALGEEWQEVLDKPEQLTDSFLKDNFYLAKKFKIEPGENYGRDAVYGVILKKR